MSDQEDLGEDLGEEQHRPQARGWLQRCCSSRCSSHLSGPENWSAATLDDGSDESHGVRYRALFPSPNVDAEDGGDVARVVDQCGMSLLPFCSGDLLEETGTVPPALAQTWALGIVRATAGSRDDQNKDFADDNSSLCGAGDETAPSTGIFPLEYAAPVLAEPRLYRAIHRFKQTAAAAERGELWFLEGDDILVTAMVLPPATEGVTKRATNSWAYGHLVKGARAGAAGLLPLAYLAVPTRKGARSSTAAPSRASIDTVPTPSPSQSRSHSPANSNAV